MKIPKIQSYIRLALSFFLLLVSFNIIQFFFLRLTVIQNIPSYLNERYDLLLNIKKNIITEANRDPKFSINSYFTKLNKHYSKLRFDFVAMDEIEFRPPQSPPPPNPFRFFEPPRRKLHRDYFLKVTLPKRQNRAATAVKIKIPQATGYLVLYHSTEFNKLDTGAAILAVFMLVYILFSLIVGFFIFQKGYRRSSELMTAVEKISIGDYSTRTNIPGNDEYSLIGKAFNKMAASIEKYTEELKAVDRQRRKFVADISHELATPLTSIQGFVETLQMEDMNLSKEEQKEYLKIVWDETERLSFLVKDLLELARMDAGTIILSYDQIECQPFLIEFSKRNSLKLKEKQVTLSWELDPGQWIYADYRRLEQIFQNLLDNALKHSDQLKKVELIFGETSATTKIIFRDDGSGIAREHLNRIFDSFYTVVNPLEQGSDSNGLGLSIVKRLVELHGGTIVVESQVNEGTTFTLEFPKKENEI